MRKCGMVCIDDFIMRTAHIVMEALENMEKDSLRPDEVSLVIADTDTKMGLSVAQSCAAKDMDVAPGGYFSVLLERRGAEQMLQGSHDPLAWQIQQTDGRLPVILVDDVTVRILRVHKLNNRLFVSGLGLSITFVDKEEHELEEPTLPPAPPATVH